MYIRDDDLYIDNALISISSDLITVRDQKLSKIFGLLELLIWENPSKGSYDENNKKNSRDTAKISSFHKKSFDTNEEISKFNSRKYKILQEILWGEKIGERLITKYKTSQLCSKMDYVYWDDPNELVEHFQLLMAEKYANKLLR